MLSASRVAPLTAVSSETAYLPDTLSPYRSTGQGLMKFGQAHVIVTLSYHFTLAILCTVLDGNLEVLCSTTAVTRYGDDVAFL